MTFRKAGHSPIDVPIDNRGGGTRGAQSRDVVRFSNPGVLEVLWWA